MKRKVSWKAFFICWKTSLWFLIHLWAHIIRSSAPERNNSCERWTWKICSNKTSLSLHSTNSFVGAFDFKGRRRAFHYYANIALNVNSFVILKWFLCSQRRLSWRFAKWFDLIFINEPFMRLLLTFEQTNSSFNCSIHVCCKNRKMSPKSTSQRRAVEIIINRRFTSNYKVMLPTFFMRFSLKSCVLELIINAKRRTALHEFQWEWKIDAESEIIN